MPPKKAAFKMKSYLVEDLASYRSLIESWIISVLIYGCKNKPQKK